MKTITKRQFFDKLEWEGSFEELANYFGHKIIEDEEDLTQVWNSFVNALGDLEAYRSDMEEEFYEE